MLSPNKGTLFIVATPIGNMADLSPRAKNCLENADLILAEDTRRAQNTCKRLEIGAKKFLSLFDKNEADRIKQVLDLLNQGLNLALISDAGTPCIADPGYLLVKACREENYPVIALPGCNSAITALSISGIAPQPFTFLGFLPRKNGDITKIFKQFANLQTTLIFFERKDRLENTLKLAYSCLNERELCIARELTKEHEEITLSKLSSPILPENMLGEFTIILGPPLEEIKDSQDIILKLIAKHKAEYKPKDLAKFIQSKTIGWKNSEIYELITGI